MSIWSNSDKVWHNIWTGISNVYASKISPFLAIVKKDAVKKGEDVLLEVGKDVLAQAKDQLGSGAKIGDVIKAAVELGIPMLERKGVNAATALLFNVLSMLAISLESHSE